MTSEVMEKEERLRYTKRGSAIKRQVRESVSRS
jgi:hypothetical protein